MNLSGALLSSSLSFIPPADIPTYTATFNSNVTAGATRIGGDAARRVLMQSRLPVNELGRIWELSDTRRTGSLSLPEFMLAMFLAQSRIKGKALPDSLPPKIAAEVAAAMNSTPVISQQQLSMPAVIGMSGPIGMTPTIGMTGTTQFNMPTPTQFNAPVTSQFNAPPPTQFAMPAPAQYNAPAPAQFNTPAPTQFSMPAPLHYTPSAEPESIETFESQFPDISLSPSSGLTLVKQTFNNHPISSSNTQPQWTITPSERAQYEGIFRRWDSGRGVLRGDQAREVFAQSSLSQTDLAKIWMLADTSNQGELNLDEFSVAMHLIFRRLAGAPIPDVLPQELVPRSSKDFMSSLTEMKEQLMVKRPSATPSAAPSASLLNDVNDFDDDGIYQSANRRRNQGSNTPSVDTRSHSPSGPSAATAESVDQLRRLVQQRKDDIQKARSDSERRHKERAESRVTGRWRIDDLKREIEDIHRNTPLTDNDEMGDRGRLLAKRQRLVASINELLLIMPALANDCERIAREVADTSKSLGRKKQDKPPLSDMEARAARLVAQRMAALTGEPLVEDDDDEPEDDRVVKAERKLRESRERVQTITSGVDHVTRAMRDLPSSSKWEDGVGVVSQEVRDFVTRLSSIERQASIRTSAFSPVIKEEEKEEVEETKKPLTIAERLAQATNKQERDRILQDIAEERFRDRQRALGIPDPSESAPPSVAVKRPEMQERAPVASNPFAAAAAAAEPVSPPVSVPTYASVPSFVSAPAAAPVSAPSFASVPVSTPAPAAAEPFGDDSSEEDEWDRDDSSDDDELPPPLGSELFGAPATGPAARVESPVSTVSFDTAFANPAAATPPAPLALKDESNPFLGLLSAATAEFEKLRLRALYPYHPDADDELAIETGDLIETLPVPASQKAVRGDGWLYGGILEESDVDDGWKLGSRTGWFPRDYAETLGAPGTRGWIKTKALFGTAKYDYEPQHEDELKVSVGQRVRVVDGDAAESWWKVRVIGTDTAGMLPAMYIDVDK